MDSITLCNKCGDSITFSVKSLPCDVMALLRGNHLPMPTEVASYKESMKEAKLELLELDRVIEDISALLERLRSKRKGTHEYIERSLALISPVRRLPNEVLEATFSHLAYPIGFWNGYFHGSDIWRIRQVCARWRDIVISTKSFWAHLSFYEDSDSYVPTEATYNQSLIKMLLDLSHHVPLHIEFHGSNSDCEDTNRFLRDFAKANTHRIQSLKIRPWNTPALADIKCLPMLERLELEDEEVVVQSESDFQSRAHRLRNAPNLRFLKIFTEWHLSTIKLPWELLESVSMSTYQSGQIAFISENCPNLVDLEWVCPRLSRESRDTKVKSLSFPQVENFTVKSPIFGKNGDSVTFLDCLQFSVLKRLEIGLEFAPKGQILHKPLHFLLSRSHNTLEQLHLDNFPIGSHFLLILQAVSQLRQFSYFHSKSLNFEYNYGENSTFCELLSSQSDALVPKLENLRLEGEHLVIDRSVVAGIESRMRCYNGISKGFFMRLSLTFKKVEFRGNTRSELERLRRDGLVVCINNVYSNWQ